MFGGPHLGCAEVSDLQGIMVREIRPVHREAAVRFVTAFDSFLSDSVNLPKSKLATLDDSVAAVYGALRADTEPS